MVSDGSDGDLEEIDHILLAIPREGLIQVLESRAHLE
jgi:hypothetical protein